MPFVTACEQEILPTPSDLFGKEEQRVKSTGTIRHNRLGNNLKNIFFYFSLVL